jgi:glycosyltransferase involved in cell wall biosynthesis
MSVSNKRNKNVFKKVELLQRQPLEEPIEFSILVPCLNEKENLFELFEMLDKVREEHSLKNFETIILDDNSADGTFEEAVRLFESYPHLNLRAIRRFSPSRGYGAIIRYGIAYAKGTFVVPVSADCVDPVDIIPQMLEKVRNGTHLVQCSRYLNNEDADTIPPLYKFYQVIWRFLLKLLLGQNIKDSTYSFRMFNRNEILALGITANRFNISAEIFLKFLLSGAKIEFLAYGQGVRKRGESHFRFRREGYGYAYGLVRAWLHRFGILWF